MTLKEVAMITNKEMRIDVRDVKGNDKSLTVFSPLYWTLLKHET